MSTKPSTHPSPPPVTDGTHAQSGRRLLYIEDSRSNLALVEWILGRELDDVEIISTVWGRAGVELACEHQPDLIVLDLGLPDMPGETVLQCLQEDVATRRIPVIVLSGDTSKKRRRLLLQLGARHYLTKPLDVRSFIDTIAAHLQPRS